MLIEKNKKINDILEEIPNDKDIFILYLNRFKLEETKRYINKNAKCDYIAVSDSLEELMDYVTDNKLTGYFDVNGVNKYYYFYEIYKYYGENMRYIERINSYYETLYYDNNTGNYYNINELTDIISQNIKTHNVCYKLGFRRSMDILGSIIVIYDESNTFAEAIKKKDIIKREDIFEEIIRINFNVVK